MEVSALRQLNTQQSYSSISSNQSSQPELVGKKTDYDKLGQGSSAEKATEREKKPLNKEDLSELTYEMNKFLEMINSDIQFSMHEKTQRLIVRVIDTRDNRVLKEFPPHEMLDTIAKIREYVGLLLDKKA
ncbi:MAG: flagellar protein FlaG [Negativicutes bacterium]|nr:flagellar protein FlaG [Negativicutes bacterium]